MLLGPLCLARIFGISFSFLSFAVPLLASALLVCWVQSRRFIIALIFSIALFYGSIVFADQHLHWGAAPDKMAWIEGTALTDSSCLGPNSRRCRINLTRSGLKSGGWVSASGEVTVVVDRSLTLFRGQILRFQLNDFSNINESAVLAAQNAVPGGWSHSLWQFRSKLYSLLLERLTRAGGESGALLSALLLGWKNDLEVEESYYFRAAGCSHILALSGMHLGILTTLIAFLLRRILKPSRVTLVSMVLVLFYLFLVGFKPSLVRAGMMFILAGVLMIKGRVLASWKILIICGFLQLLLFPEDFFSVSFWFSYLALAGLILFSGPIDQFLNPWLPGFVGSAFSACFSAQIFLLPLSALLFGEIRLIGLIASIAAAPLLVLFLWTGIGAALSPEGITFCFTKVLELEYRCLTGTLKFFGNFPSMTFSGFYGVVILVMIEVLLLFGIRKYQSILFTGGKYGL